MPGSRSFFAVVLILPLVAAHAASRVQPVPTPAAMRSDAFTVKVNGKAVDVVNAAANYDYINFDMTGPATIEITSAERGFWDRGVDIEPWRLGLRAERRGQTIRFKLRAPAKLSISRPRDFLNTAHMLFVFAGTPPPKAPQGENVHVYPAGVYRQSLNPKSGETLYLEPGAVFYGSLNLWKVDHVKVLGRGTIVYDGPQDPLTDQGWMQKPDWHCIDSLNAHDVEVDGVTCILRSRTWSIQLKDSSKITFDDLRVVGGNPGNANQDGIDWIGSSDGIVRNSFFRASDDVIALMGNWDGYTEADMLRPGKDVHDIVVENSVLSTSISNVVRAGWPRKIFNSRTFVLRNSDVLHAGIGACGQTFGLLGFWGANGARGEHASYTFENLFLDNWYSLLQIEQDQPALRGFSFRNIWALDQPPLAGSSLIGAISDVTLENVKYGQKLVQSNADVPLSIDDAQPVRYLPSAGPVAAFTMQPPGFRPGDKVTFTAKDVKHTHFTWFFGDGAQGHGRRVTHTFHDTDGTELDGRNGAGRFRVMLKAVDDQGRQDWASQGIVVVSQWREALKPLGQLLPGVSFQVYPGDWSELPDTSSLTAALDGNAPNLNANAQGFTKYAVTWDGYIDVPADGGYTFHLMDRDGARVTIDGVQVAQTGPAFAQVCGSPGNAVRYDRGALGLRAGLHRLHVEALHTESQGPPRLLWEGPGLPATDVPPGAFRRLRQDVLRDPLERTLPRDSILMAAPKQSGKI